MGLWDKVKKSINPGEDDDNTYDDDEFEEDYSMGGGYNDFGANDMPVSGNFSQQNPVYTQNAPNYNNYQQPMNNNPPPASAISVTPVSGGDIHASFEVKVIKPESYADGKRIADLLMARKTVIVNFEETNKEIIRKLLDFMAGAAYVFKGELNRVSERTFIMTPPNARFSLDQIKNAERGDMGRDNSIY
jgi:FtsZ-interacting cell division protein YlmF